MNRPRRADRRPALAALGLLAAFGPARAQEPSRPPVTWKSNGARPAPAPLPTSVAPAAAPGDARWQGNGRPAAPAPAPAAPAELVPVANGGTGLPPIPPPPANVFRPELAPPPRPVLPAVIPAPAPTIAPPPAISPAPLPTQLSLPRGAFTIQAPGTPTGGAPAPAPLPAPASLPAPAPAPLTTPSPAPAPNPAPAPVPEPPSVALPPPRELRGAPVPKERPADPTRPNAEANDPEELQVLLGSARNAAKDGDFELAVRRFRQYLEKNPGEPRVLVELAGVYFQADRIPEAIQIFEDLIRAERAKANDQRDDLAIARYLLSLADLANRQRDPQRAIGRLLEAMAITADDKLTGARSVRLDAAARLGQLYVSEGMYPKACEIFDRFFLNLKLDDTDAPVRLIGFLLDLERPKVAQLYLPALLERFPESAELHTGRVRMFAQLGDRVNTSTAVEDLNKRIPRDIDTRLALVRSLIGLEEFEPANTVLAQIFAVRPNHPPAMIVQGELNVRALRLPLARIALEQVKPVGRDQEREWLQTRAGYHESAGELTQAKLLYDAILRREPFEYGTRVALGNLYIGTSEFERAKAEFVKVPPTSREFRAARRGLARALSSQRKFAPAIDLLEELTREAPWDATNVVQYLQTLSRAGNYGRAIEIGTGYLQVGAPYQSAEALVRAAMGRVFLEGRRPLEADQQFAAALKLSFCRNVSAIYGLTKLSHMFGDPLRFPPAACAGQPCDELRLRLLLSDLYSQDGDAPHALEFATFALRMDPLNLAALVRVAEAHQGIARQTGIVGDAVYAAKAVLSSSPANNRGLYALARSHGTAMNYMAAADAYRKLIDLDVEAAPPKRELARILYADHQYDEAQSTYMSVAQPDPAMAFRQTLQIIATRVPNGKLALEGLAAGKLPPEQLKGDIAKLVANVQDPLLASGLNAAVADYEARVVEAQLADLEAKAKSAKGIRDLTAIPIYKELIAAEPNNSEGLFDLGQIYSGRQMTHSAIGAYSELLGVDPLFREAGVASDRAMHEASPTVKAFAGYEHEAGRDGLANMDRTRIGATFTTPLGDENEYVGVGLAYLGLQPSDDSRLNGNVASLLYQQRLPWADQTLFRGVLNGEFFPDRLNSRATGEAGFRTMGDGWNCYQGLFVENVTASGEALRQSIYRAGALASGDYQVNRRAQVNGQARLAHYSDDNDMAGLDLGSAYLVSYAPRQLRVLLNTQSMWFREQSVFGPFSQFDPLNSRGTIHPYFAPRNFSYYEIRFDWMHYLSRDFFAHSNNCYYQLQYAFGFDNQGIMYNTFRAGFNYDISPALTVGMDARYMTSSVYEFASIYAFLVLRMPNCPRL